VRGQGEHAGCLRRGVTGGAFGHKRATQAVGDVQGDRLDEADLAVVEGRAGCPVQAGISPVAVPVRNTARSSSPSPASRRISRNGGLADRSPRVAVSRVATGTGATARDRNLFTSGAWNSLLRNWPVSPSGMPTRTALVYSSLAGSAVGKNAPSAGQTLVSSCSADRRSSTDPRPAQASECIRCPAAAKVPRLAIF